MCQFLSDAQFFFSVSIVAFAVIFGVVRIRRRRHVFVIVYVVVQLAMNPQRVPRYSTVQVWTDGRRRPACATGWCRRRGS